MGILGKERVWFWRTSFAGRVVGGSTVVGALGITSGVKKIGSSKGRSAGALLVVAGIERQKGPV